MTRHIALTRAIALLSCLSLPCVAEQPVAYWHKTDLGIPQSHALYGNVHLLSVFRGEPDVSPIYFKVYTTTEIDGKVHDLTTRITVADERTGQALSATETKLREELVRATDALPQRVLNDVAGRALKDAIISELRAEIQTLRERIAALEEKRGDQ